MREGSDCGDKVLNYASKFLTVLPAVVRYRGGFVGAERWTLQDSIAHLVFMRGADSVFVEILQRAVDAVESLRALSAFDAAVIGEVAKLDVGVDRASRLSPSARKVHTVLCSVVVRDEQRAGVEPIRWERAEFAGMADANCPAGPHLKSDEAVRGNQITLPASIGESLSRIEFGVDTPNLLERKFAPAVKPRRHRRQRRCRR